MKKKLSSDEFRAEHRASEKCFVRERLLTFERLFVMQLSLMRSSIDRELSRFFGQLCALGDSCETPTGGAFCRARKKMLPEAFGDMNEAVTDLFYRKAKVKRWHGMRLLSFDGTTLRVRGKRETREHFGQIENSGRTYSLARAVQLYDVLNGIVLGAEMDSNRIGERDLARRCFPKLGKKDLVLLDIGYPGFSFFSELRARNAHFCARISSKQWQRSVRPFLDSGLREQLIKLSPDSDARAECRRRGVPETPMLVRAVRVDLPGGDTEVLLTSLLDVDKHPYKRIARLYTRRWRVEESYKTLKCRIEWENFSGKTVRAVLQDFHARVLAFTLTVLLSKPADEQSRMRTADRQLDYQINLTNALAELRRRMTALLCTNSIGGILEEFWERIARCLSAIRPDRHEPRTKTPRDKKARVYAFAYKPIS